MEIVKGISSVRMFSTTEKTLRTEYKKEAVLFCNINFKKEEK